MWGMLEWGSIKPEDITVRALGARGLVALYCMKRALMQHIMNCELGRIGLVPSIKAVFKDVMGYFASYRQRLNHRQQVLDLRRQVAWTGSAKDMLLFIENLVFGDTHDLCLKNAI